MIGAFQLGLLAACVVLFVPMDSFHPKSLFLAVADYAGDVKMGSEGPAPVVTVHVTGFKKFHEVAENPTETIVNKLQGYMKKRGLSKGLILGRCTVLETAGHGALVPLYQTLQSAVSKDASMLGRVIWIIFCTAIPNPHPFPRCIPGDELVNHRDNPVLVLRIQGSIRIHTFVAALAEVKKIATD